MNYVFPIFAVLVITSFQRCSSGSESLGEKYLNLPSGIKASLIYSPSEWGDELEPYGTENGGTSVWKALEPIDLPSLVDSTWIMYQARSEFNRNNSSSEDKAPYPIRLELSVVEHTHILAITLRSDNPDFGKNFLELLIDEFIGLTLENLIAPYEKRSQELAMQLDSVSLAIHILEDSLAPFVHAQETVPDAVLEELTKHNESYLELLSQQANLFISRALLAPPFKILERPRM